MRDYASIVERVNQLPYPVIEIGKIRDLPIFQLKIESISDSYQEILITAGIHGDEPAGVEAALQFVERDVSKLQEDFSFLVIPCINPYGFVHDMRENCEGVDINRAFEKDNVEESEVVKCTLNGKQFAFSVDFHEDYDAKGFYLYEGNRDQQFIGPKLVRACLSIGQLDPDDPGEDAPEISKGVYRVAEHWGTQGLAPYLLHHHSAHVLISETPTIWNLQQRVDLHLTLLDTALTLI